MTYCELHCHSYFSLLDGASSPAALVRRAAQLGLPALALTDHDAVYGAVQFVEAARQAGLHPILGAELTLSDASHLTLLVQDSAGWRNLCTLITLARAAAPKGQAALSPAALAEYSAGLLCLSGCRRGEIPAALWRADPAAALRAARRLRDLFGPERFYLELQHHQRPGDAWLNRQLARLGQALGLAVVATHNVHYATADQHALHDLLVCLRRGIPLRQWDPARPLNASYALHSQAELAPAFAAHPTAVPNSRRLAERCDFQLRYGLQSLPAFPTPAGESAETYLQHLCQTALARQPQAAALAESLAHELPIIAAAGLANYFLIVWDIVRYARARGIRCQGRGSAANSLVAYLLGISPIDPHTHALVFERFLAPERPHAPDIDIDFDAARREEVIQYLYRRYGPEHVAMACTFVTFRARSALRDVSRALGLSPEAAALALDRLQNPTAAGAPEAGDAQLLDLARQLDGLPRHLGLHNGGMVVMGAPLSQRLPVEPAAMPGRSVVQWDKDSLEVAGLVKIDILGLRTLSVIDESLRLAGHPALPTAYDDPAIYARLSAADTIGIFQVESRAQSQLLPRLRPADFPDLIVAISLIRPGPIQGNMVQPYLRRRAGLEPVRYAHPLLEPALRETLGVILFQEQVLKVARDLAGWTPGQGEQLRRALGRADPSALQDLRQAFLAGAAEWGVSAEIAAQVFEQLRAFGGYAFPKSHGAAFAVLVYQAAWLRYRYPAAYYCALLNHQPMGFWTPAVLVRAARRQGVTTRPVDIGRSQARCVLEEGAIRLGLNYVQGWGEQAVAACLAARQAAPFTGLADVLRRVPLSAAQVEALILAGGLDAWGERRQLLWQARQLVGRAHTLPLPLAPAPPLPDLTPAAAQAWEQQATGLTTGPHALALYRAQLAARGLLDSRQAQAAGAGARVTMAGVLVVHQSPPTAKGFHFLTLEDEWGLVDVILRPALYARYRRLLHTTRWLLVTGHVQREGAAVNLLATRLASLVDWLG